MVFFNANGRLERARDIQPLSLPSPRRIVTLMVYTPPRAVAVNRYRYSFVPETVRPMVDKDTLSMSTVIVSIVLADDDGALAVHHRTSEDRYRRSSCVLPLASLRHRRACQARSLRIFWLTGLIMPWSALLGYGAWQQADRATSCTRSRTSTHRCAARAQTSRGILLRDW